MDRVILQLIQGQAIGDQGTLLEALAARGFELTQSTLSRHLKRLQVVKQEGSYRKLEPAPAWPPCVLREAPPNMLVLQTSPGFAQPLAAWLDAHPPEGLAGTIAGDDTVFIALSQPARLEGVRRELEGILKGQREA